MRRPDPGRWSSQAKSTRAASASTGRWGAPVFTATPAWIGAVPRILNVTNYNFEIFTAGEPSDATQYHQGLPGMLNGLDMITLLEDRRKANALLNPYMLELLRTAEVTPAYLYPSQDVWAYNGIAGDSPVLGLQTGPLNGQAAFGDKATFDWYLGGGGGAEHHHLYVTTDGNCGAKSPCYDSIQKAINAASTGSIIWIAAGMYSEDITLANTLIFQGGVGYVFRTEVRDHNRERCTHCTAGLADNTGVENRTEIGTILKSRIMGRDPLA